MVVFDQQEDLVASVNMPHGSKCFILHFLFSLSTAFVAAGIVIALGMGIGLCTMLSCDMET